MKYVYLLAVLMSVSTVNISQADVILTTATLDSADLDFDGAGIETSGDLGTNSMVFNLASAGIPSTPEFANITSISLSFSTPVGTTLSAGGGGILPPGIGMTFPGEFSPNVTGFSENVGEILQVSVSSTSTSGEVVQLQGIEFNNWRNTFPFSEVTLTGATFGGGNNVLTGSDTSPLSPILDFDNGVSTFFVESTGNDLIRMANIRLSVSSSAVPEPMSALPMIMLTGGLLARRKRRNCFLAG